MFTTTRLIAAIPLLSYTLIWNRCSSPVFITWVGISLEYDASLPPNPSVGVPLCTEEKLIPSTDGGVISHDSPLFTYGFVEAINFSSVQSGTPTEGFGGR